MYAHGNETNNQRLVNDSAYSPNVLYKMPDREFAQTVKGIVNLSTEYLPELADQAVTEDQITEVTTSLDDFYELIGMPRSVVVQTSTAGKELDQLIKETNDLLNHQLDMVMLRFKLSDTSFYDGYERARVIVD